jgi:hypothetical protein
MNGLTSNRRGLSIVVAVQRRHHAKFGRQIPKPPLQFAQILVIEGE